MSERADVVPATLSFLAIYNPSLSRLDETFEDQIVYYYSKPRDARKTSRQKDDGEWDETKEEKDEKLRHIGLAQGMVSFAKNFSNGKAVDCIETEKSRIILHELELDWWLLASIDLTRLPGSSDTPAIDQSQSFKAHIEYSARELSPPTLLLQKVLRAHQIFLLHQAPSITDLYARVTRPKFCGILKRFWDGFIWNWDVLLHGNPAVDIFNGLKLAAGGELGIGVGEEEWGSGEREVLEGFIGRTDGLVDLVVSRFGEAPDLEASLPTSASSDSMPQDVKLQMRDGRGYPRPVDGVVFSGIGALTRPSVRDVSSWMEWLYRYGKDAYGVGSNPSSAPRRTRRNNHSTKPDGPSKASRTPRSQGNEHLTKANSTPGGPGIPPSIVAVDRARNSVSATSPSNAYETSRKEDQTSKDATSDDSTSGTDSLMKYLTLGVYGSTWGIPSGRPPVHNRVSSLRKELSLDPGVANTSNKNNAKDQAVMSGGYFLIGLQGELDESVRLETTNSDIDLSTDAENTSESNVSNNCVRMRTLHVERVYRKPTDTDDILLNTEKETTKPYYDRLRVVVYVQKPFIFTFLFEFQTDALAIPSFYRSLHHQLGPLQRPLLSSTSPRKVSERLWEAAAPKSTASTASNQPICDLVYDPLRLTVHTTIPNIPEPGGPPPSQVSAASSSPSSPPWTRVEALSVHSQILNTYSSTRRHPFELERTCKTSRGWWVVWMRLPYSSEEQKRNADAESPKTFREAFLIRKASDYVSPAARKASSRFRRDVSGASGSGNGGWGPGKLAEGIGIDARQYIEGLLSLNR